MGRSIKISEDELLDRAMQLFWKKGFSRTSIRDLEKCLDLKAPSIYRRFQGKEQLEVAVMERYINQVIIPRINLHLSNTKDPVTNLWDFFSSAVRIDHSIPSTIGCLLTMTSADGHNVSEAVQKIALEGLRQTEWSIKKEVQRAIKQGIFPIGTDAKKIAKTLLIGLHGLMVLAGVGHSEKRLLGFALALFESTITHKTLTERNIL